MSSQSCKKLLDSLYLTVDYSSLFLMKSLDVTIPLSFK